MKEKENPKKEDKNRSNSYKKPVISSGNNKNPSSNSNPALKKESGKVPRDNSYEENVIDEEIEIEEKAKMENKRKVKDDLDAMKRTMRNENNEEFFAFQ